MINTVSVQKCLSSIKENFPYEKKSRVSNHSNSKTYKTSGTSCTDETSSCHTHSKELVSSLDSPVGGLI